jgi:16S rRNA (cytosine967-C5)-methyltransferase
VCPLFEVDNLTCSSAPLLSALLKSRVILLENLFAYPFCNKIDLICVLQNQIENVRLAKVALRPGAGNMVNAILRKLLSLKVKPGLLRIVSTLDYSVIL